MMMYISKNNEKNLNYFNFLDVVAEASLLNYIVQESLLKEAALTVPGQLVERFNAFVSETGGLRFKSWADQSGRSVANNSTQLRHFFERRFVACRRNYLEMGSLHALATRYTLRRNSTSIIKDLTCFDVKAY